LTMLACSVINVFACAQLVTSLLFFCCTMFLLLGLDRLSILLQFSCLPIIAVGCICLSLLFHVFAL
jgi:hypothetical protein